MFATMPRHAERACYLALILLAGCGRPMADVSGTVLIDRAPLADGEIIFEEIDKSQTPAATKIAAGKYHLTMLPGKKVVRITASRPTKIPDPVMGSAAREAMIGRDFNENSSLRAEIQPGIHDNVNFEVKSLP